MSTADILTSGQLITGQLSTKSDDDYYKLDVSNAGTITLKFNSTYNDYDYHDVSILNSSGQELAGKILGGGSDEKLYAEVDTSGSYYVLARDGSYYLDIEEYNITATYSTTSGMRETEPKSSISTADTIQLGKKKLRDKLLRHPTETITK